MFQSFRYSQLALRFGLAAVFLWFGVDKFIHPEYWINAWMPSQAISIAETIGLTANNLATISGIFEVLVGISLLSNIFTKFFSLLAALFLALIFILFGTQGFNEILMRDIGLIGGLLAIFFWPRKSL